ncbi:hypothetical protein TNCT_171361 [Trichonephila clavata]|uniref:Uncharacterized protein n=1 Tax=Trichonephila clavata TaxID=2740835 RepID=A0A8X6LZ95_TRICU|nr:hypothetical protein TNCT_171361 [Trichonephila clavata]
MRLRDNLGIITSLFKHLSQLDTSYQHFCGGERRLMMYNHSSTATRADTQNIEGPLKPRGQVNCHKVGFCFVLVRNSSLPMVTYCVLFTEKCDSIYGYYVLLCNFRYLEGPELSALHL